MRHWLAAIVICGALAFVVGTTSAQGAPPWEEYQAQQPLKPNYSEKFDTTTGTLPNRYSIYNADFGVGSTGLRTMILLDHQTGRTWVLSITKEKGAVWAPISYAGGAPK